jgi:hypothetical protein
MENVTPESTRPRKTHMFKTGQERLAALRKIRGMWKGREPDPITWLEESRKESDRELPPRHP